MENLTNLLGIKLTCEGYMLQIILFGLITILYLLVIILVIILYYSYILAK